MRTLPAFVSRLVAPVEVKLVLSALDQEARCLNDGAGASLGTSLGIDIITPRVRENILRWRNQIQKDVQNGKAPRAIALWLMMDVTRDYLASRLDGRVHGQLLHASGAHGVGTGIVPNIAAVAAKRDSIAVRTVRSIIMRCRSAVFADPNLGISRVFTKPPTGAFAKIAMATLSSAAVVIAILRRKTNWINAAESRASERPRCGGVSVFDIAQSVFSTRSMQERRRKRNAEFLIRTGKNE
jgi:hypothetical protein